MALGASSNGIYNHCLGADCPTPCCDTKSARLCDGEHRMSIDFMQPSIVNGKQISFTLQGTECNYCTTVTEEEAKNIGDAHPEVSLQPAEIRAGGGTITTILLSKCLGASGCTLGPRKPMMCKLYPFSEYIIDGIHERSCPAAFEIAMDEDNIKQMVSLRKELWLTDNKEYISFIYDILIKREKKPDWKFLQDEEYIRSL